MLLQNDALGGEFWNRATFPRPHSPDVRPEHDDKDDPVFRYENLQEEPDVGGFRLRQIIIQRSDDEGYAMPVVNWQRMEVQKQKAVHSEDGPRKPRPRRAITREIPAE
jgi:hypothetical protein